MLEKGYLVFISRKYSNAASDIYEELDIPNFLAKKVQIFKNKTGDTPEILEILEIVIQEKL